jgi:hypothetical protein
VSALLLPLTAVPTSRARETYRPLFEAKYFDGSRALRNEEYTDCHVRDNSILNDCEFIRT